VKIARKNLAACCLNLVLPAGLALALTTTSAAAQVKPAPAKHGSTKSWVVRCQPQSLVNGAPVLFRVVTPARLETLSGKWLEHEVFFNYDSASKSWYGIAGTSLETVRGAYPLTLQGTTSNGKEVSFEQKIKVSAAKYPSFTTVTVPTQFTEPSPQQLQQINQEKTLKQEIFGRVEPQREWSGGFRPPVNAPVSDVFGTRRIFNGKVQSVHQGLDFAVPQGTPVSALNAGTVLLARPMFFEGNCVVLDHGQGLLTLYLHLSEIKVKEGEQVTSGQELGLSGSTGRATGPHLHVAVRWQGVYLNPAALLNLKLPGTT
jgi:murein DD-endopeptidase MepM/ murein hydrolase activator NlpD